MFVGSVCTHPSYNDKNPPSGFLKIPILKSYFSNQAVLRFLSEWRSSTQAPITIVDWQDRLTLDWESWVKLSWPCIDIVARVQQWTELNLNTRTLFNME